MLENTKEGRLSDSSFGVKPNKLSPLANAVKLCVFGAGVGLATSAHAASVVVTSNTDDGAMCTLREAIRSVNLIDPQGDCLNASAEPFGTNDTITFSNPGEIVLGGEGELVIQNDVVIDASSVGGITLNADLNSRVLSAVDELIVTFKNLTITGGSTTGSGGGVSLGERSELMIIDSSITGNQSGSFGGGLFIGAGSGTEITRSEISSNTSTQAGGGIATFDSELTLLDTTVSGNSSINEGGGLYTSGYSTLTLTNSTVSANSAGYNDTHNGGGILSTGGYLNLNNSTVSGNYVYREGGGIWSAAYTVLTNTTISDNTTAYQKTAGVYMVKDASLTLANSILANSIGGDDCAAPITISDSNSIIEDGSCGSRAGDPGLLPLADNGGPTLTHGILSSSAAFDSGDNSTCLPNDQRGESRRDGNCDVGAFELDNSGFFVIPTANGRVVVIPE